MIICHFRATPTSSGDGVGCRPSAAAGLPKFRVIEDMLYSCSARKKMQEQDPPVPGQAAEKKQTEKQSSKKGRLVGSSLFWPCHLASHLEILSSFAHVL